MNHQGLRFGSAHEITSFQGLGEISANEFKDFIIENLRVEKDLVEA